MSTKTASLREGAKHCLTNRQYQEAIDLASAIRPANRTAFDWSLLSQSYLALKEFRMALRAEMKGLLMAPKDYHALNRLGVIQIELQRWREAKESLETSYKTAIERSDATFNAPLLNLGAMSQMQGDYEKAVDYYTSACALTMQNFNPSRQSINAAELQPLMWLGLAQMTARSKNPNLLAAGLNNYQYRLMTNNVLPQNGVKLWNGEPTDHLVIYHEQGLGDGIWTWNLMRDTSFWNYYGVKRVTLVTDPKLYPLLNMQPKDGYVNVVCVGDEVEPHEYHMPTMEILRWRHLAGLMAFNNPTAKYPIIEPVKMDFWPELELEPQQEILNIAICPNGNPNHLNDRYRSFTTEQIVDLVAQLRESMKCRLFWVSQNPLPDVLADMGVETADIPDLVCLTGFLSHMDFVLTVDTLTAHLAANMGLPTLMFCPANPDFRWGLTNADQNMAYWAKDSKFAIYRQRVIGKWDTRDFMCIPYVIENTLNSKVTCG